MMCKGFSAHAALGDRISTGKFVSGGTVRAGRLLGAVLGGMVLAAATGAAMAKDPKSVAPMKPAQLGKICDSYGPGFLLIPGTNGT
jgi:hypothetical protein